MSEYQRVLMTFLGNMHPSIISILSPNCVVFKNIFSFGGSWSNHHVWPNEWWFVVDLIFQFLAFYQIFAVSFFFSQLFLQIFPACGFILSFATFCPIGFQSFPMCFPCVACFHHGFHHGFPIIFPSFSSHFPMVFPSFSHGFPVVFLRFLPAFRPARQASPGPPTDAVAESWPWPRPRTGAAAAWENRWNMLEPWTLGPLGLGSMTLVI